MRSADETIRTMLMFYPKGEPRRCIVGTCGETATVVLVNQLGWASGYHCDEHAAAQMEAVAAAGLKWSAVPLRESTV